MVWKALLLAAGATLVAPPGAHAQDAGGAGALAVSRRHPAYFEDAAGQAVLLVGDYTWGTFSDTDYDFVRMFDALKAAGLNFARVWVWWGCEEFPQTIGRLNRVPYVRPGPGLGNDGRLKYDLGRFDPAFFAHLRDVCAAARDRGIFLQLTLFDAWMIKHADLWKLHAFQRDNNISGVDGDLGDTGVGTDGEKGFCSLGNPGAMAAQKAFTSHVVDAVNEFPNILFEIANENYYNEKWELTLCEFIHELEKGEPRQHLTMPLDVPNHDYGGIKTYDLNELHSALLGARALGKPLIFDTDGIGNPDDATVRKAAWTAFTSGGNIDYLDDSLQPGPEFHGDEEGSKRADLRRQLGHLASVTRLVRFWEMAPGDDMVRGGRAFVLASADEVVAYLPDGGEVGLDVARLAGERNARWLDPRSGEWSDAGQVEGGAVHTFTAPDGSDWVLLLRRAEDGP